MFEKKPSQIPIRKLIERSSSRGKSKCVLCKNCKYYWYDYLGMVLPYHPDIPQPARNRCDFNPRKEITPIGIDTYSRDAQEVNKNNDCPDFKAKLVSTTTLITLAAVVTGLMVFSFMLHFLITKI